MTDASPGFGSLGGHNPLVARHLIFRDGTVSVKEVEELLNRAKPWGTLGPNPTEEGGDERNHFVWQSLG